MGSDMNSENMAVSHEHNWRAFRDGGVSQGYGSPDVNTDMPSARLKPWPFSQLVVVVLSFLMAAGMLTAQNSSASGSAAPRACDLGIPVDGTPGPLNAINDIPGVEVGYKTLISGEGRLVVGEGPVRTGVTTILPRGKNYIYLCINNVTD